MSLSIDEFTRGVWMGAGGKARETRAGGYAKQGRGGLAHSTGFNHLIESIYIID